MTALLAIVFGLLFFVLLVLLHFLKPNLTPSSNMISQYAVGKYGWIMQVAFCCFGVSCLALGLALLPYLENKLGPMLLIIIAVSTVGIGIFNTDPLDPVRDARSLPSSLHNLFSVIVVPLCPITASILYFELSSNPQFAPHRYLVGWLSILVWVSFIGYLSGMAYFQLSKQRVHTKSPLGYVNRLMVTAYALWVTAVAWIVSVSG